MSRTGALFARSGGADTEPAARAVLLIARREAIGTARSMSFVVSTAVAAVLLACVVWLQHTAFDRTEHSTIGLAGQAIAVSDPLVDAAAQLDHEVRTIEVSDLDAGRAMVADGEIDALVSGAPSALRVLVFTELADDLHGVLNGLMKQQVLIAQLAATDQRNPTDVVDSLRDARVEVDALDPAAALDSDRTIVALTVAGLLCLALALYAGRTAGGVVAEKSTGVVESVLSVARSRQLLAGTVLGLGLAGLIQFTVVGVVWLALAAATGAAAATTAATLGWGLLWFALGHLLYGTAFAAAGSLASDRRDLPRTLLPFGTVLLVACATGVGALATAPTAAVTTVLSLVPGVSPVLLPGRMAVTGAVPAWQVLTAILAMLVTIAIVARILGRVHHNAVLHLGGRLRLRDALR